MGYPQFTLKEDWYLENEIAGQKSKYLLFKKGHIFNANSNGEYLIEYFGGELKYDVDGMRLANIFNEENIEIIIEEIPDDDDNLVGNWRIQLDVKTTRKKLKEVQRIIEEYVRPIVN